MHIGKASYGWKFLFHEVNYSSYDYELQLHTFEEWKKYLEEHIGKDMVILDEEDREVALKDFLELVEEKQKTTNENDFKYSKNVEGYRFTEGDFS